MAVEMARKRPGLSTGDNGAILVLVVVVLSVQETLDHLDGEMDDDPILGRAVVETIGGNAVLPKPLVD